MTDFIHEFPSLENLIYLNHAGVAPWPRRTTAAVQSFAEENLRFGAKHYSRWLEEEAKLRSAAQRLLNAPSAEDIALLKNTSEALSIVGHGLNWQAGENVVITNQEFPSNRIVWESLQEYGVKTREADITGDNPEAAIFAQADEKTRLIAVSSVQYASGLRLDLAKIGDFCRQHHLLFCLDAIQSLGAIRLDVQAINADFVMADGHKWLLGPEGLAIFYCRREQREQLRLRQFGWHMVENHLNFDAKIWQAASTARRFECGSPNMLGIYGLNASLSLLLEIGMETIEQQVLANSRFLLDALRQSPKIEILSAQSPNRYAGIVTFRCRHRANEWLFAYLAEQNIICAQRGGGIRFSPHFYLSQEKLAQAVEHVLSV